MAQTLQDPSTRDHTAGPFTVSVEAPVAAARQAAAPVEASRSAAKRSPMTTALLVMFASIVIVLASTMGMMLVLTEVSVWAAFGLGAYCAFWLGGGFGTIFGSAVVFSGEH